MADIISTQYMTGVVGDIASYLKQYLTVRGLTTVTQADLEEQLIIFNNARKDAPLVLSAIKPDYEQFVSQMLSFLKQTDATVWNELHVAGGGRTLIDFVGAIGAFIQNTIESGLHEKHFDTAQATSSIYMMTRDRGIHVQRKIPASVFSTMTNSTPSEATVIPRLTQFSIDGIKFFNRADITFPKDVGSLTGIQLFQGDILYQLEESNGSSGQIFEIGAEDFSVSDTDIYVFVGPQDEEYLRTTRGIYHFGPGESVFHENTLPSGNVELVFGTGIFGRKPEGNSEIRIKYVQTLGEKGNKAATGRSVICSGYPSVTGLTTSNIENGDDEADPNLYRIIAPNLYAAKERAVTREDYKAIALTYMGVKDIIFRGQQEIAPSQITHINYIEAYYVSDHTWTTDEKLAFKTWMSKYSIGNVVMGILEATPIAITINADVYCKAGIDLVAAKNHLINKVREEFSVQTNIIGKPRFMSDIIVALADERFSVDYVKLNQPSTDYVPDETSYVTLNLDTLVVNTHYSNRNFGVQLV